MGSSSNGDACGGYRLSRAQSSVGTPSPKATTDAFDARVDALMANMTAADRVGQLFLITFQGNDISFDSDIAELIYGYRVGGVVISPRNGNFTNEKNADTPKDVATLTNQLQALAYGILLPADRALQPLSQKGFSFANMISMEKMTNVPPINVPLFIGVEQAGNDLPYTALRRGFTPLPSEMALGATWDPELTNKVGQIVGRELHAVGVNMLLGPNLDVLALPRPDQVGSLGLQSFGGDPYWVSQLGRAYIAGVHTGSEDRVATVASHFPGAGDTDRMPDEEVATVQRSLPELEHVTLPPFESVTRRPSIILSPDGGDPASTDAMMSSHLRYSGFQGNSLGRNTPISLAPELETVLEQEGFADWRAQGGLMVSNALGVPAIRLYYSPTLSDFPYRRAALDAFTAGHDVLYLDRFSLDDKWETEKQNIKETIGFFQERYIKDPEFASQVDTAVRRILRMKLRLYSPTAGQPAQGQNGTATPLSAKSAPTPTLMLSQSPQIPLANVLVRATDLNVLQGDSHTNALATVGQVARESLTILSPDPSSSSDMVSVVPQAGDHVLIVTESRLVQECSQCVAEASVGPDELANIIEQLYGPSATGQLKKDQLVSLTFADLAQLLTAERKQAATPAPSPTPSTPTPTTVPAPTAQPDTGANPVLGDTAEPGSISNVDKNTKNSMLIDQANWIIFAMLDVDTQNYPNSDVVKQFLRQHGDQLASKHIIVLALHAPYFLDATEISKLNGYYGVYGKTQPFLESAIRALFRAYTPVGAPPVSVPGTRFGSLADRLKPDLARQIDMQILDADGQPIVDQNTAGGAPLPGIDAGKVIRVQVGPVYDLNGKTVRDGTQVDFQLAYEGDESAPRIESATTHAGVATRDLMLDRGGVVHVEATIGDATAGEPIAINVQGAATNASAVATVGTDTTPVIASASLATNTSLSSSVALLAPNAGSQPVAEDSTRVNIATLMIALLTMLATTGLLLIVQVHVLPRQTLVHSLLWAINCGLGAYILYGLGLMPGAAWLQSSLRVWGVAIVVFIGMLLPLLWLQLRME